jgi:hypothetical protein
MRDPLARTSTSALLLPSKYLVSDVRSVGAFEQQIGTPFAGGEPDAQCAGFVLCARRVGSFVCALRVRFVVLCWAQYWPLPPWLRCCAT